MHTCATQNELVLIEICALERVTHVKLFKIEFILLLFLQMAKEPSGNIAGLKIIQWQIGRIRKSFGH